MSEGHDLHGVAADADRGPTGARSHAERVKERRAQRARQQAAGQVPELDLVLPEGEIVAVYKRTNLKAVRKAGAQKGATAANVSLLLDACVRVDWRDPDTGERGSWAEETDRPDVPVRFDSRLADLLEIDEKDPRQILVQVFEGNDRAILSHAMRVDRWSSGEDLDADSPEEVDELLGEADAAT